MNLLGESIISTKPMLKKTRLPLNTETTRMISFPRANCCSYTRIPRKRPDQMHVIRHDHKGLNMPFLETLIDGDAAKDLSRPIHIT